MGRRNYDLTGITPRSPAWILQQERKHRRAGLSGLAPVHELPSTPTGGQNDLPVDEDQTPRALPTLPEEETDDRTPTVANFPRLAGRLQGKDFILKQTSEPPASVEPKRTSQRPPFDPECSDSDPPVEDSFQKPHGRVTSDDGLAIPSTHREARALEFQDDVAQAYSREGAPSNGPAVPPWQPMTMEDFHIGNMVLHGLAAQGSIGAQASSFNGCQHAIMCSRQNDASGEDIVMGEGWWEQDTGVSTFPGAPYHTFGA